MSDETRMINEDDTLTVNWNDWMYTDEQNNHWRYYCKHGKTMIMMWKATGDKKYLQRAKLDLFKAKSIKECGFVRPLGCYLAA